MLKKLALTMLAVSMALPMAGCKFRNSEDVPNAERGTDYSYDWVDFVTITAFGINGSGYLEVTRKDLTADDIENQDDYIKLKAVFDDMDPYCIADYDTEGLKISQKDGLSNGDVITIKPDYDEDDLNGLDLNLEGYEFVVAGLVEDNPVDLFANDVVSFYVLDGTTEGYAFKLSDNKLSKELLDNITYTVDVNEKDSSAVEINKTTLSVSVDMNEDFLTSEDNSYYSFDVYLAKHGMSAVKTKEVVLENVVEPLDFTTISSDTVVSALYDAIYERESVRGNADKLGRICNIQFVSNQGTADPYSYSVVYYLTTDQFNEDGSPVYKYQKASVRLVRFNNTLVVLSVDNIGDINEMYATEPLNGGEILMSFQ